MAVPAAYRVHKILQTRRSILAVGLGESRLAPEDTLPPVTTVSYRVAQFIARQKPLVADFNVPIPEGHNPVPECLPWEAKPSLTFTHAHPLPGSVVWRGGSVKEFHF